MKQWWQGLVSVKEYAEIKKMAVSTVRRQCAEGEIDAAMVGETWIIKLEPHHERVCDDIGIGNVRL